MPDEQERAVLEEMILKTRDGKIRWEPTASDEGFSAALAGKYAISFSFRVHPWGQEYSLVLKDRENRTLTSISSIDEGIDQGRMRLLYEEVRRRALKSDEKVEEVLGELKRL